MKRSLTCIVCPLGCTIEAEIADGKVTEISGNSCPRGKNYAESECISPKRVVTTTVRCKNGELLPVKTDRPIPKGKVLSAMKIIKSAYPILPISAGDIIIKNVFGSDIVAVRNIG